MYYCQSCNSTSVSFGRCNNCGSTDIGRWLFWMRVW